MTTGVVIARFVRSSASMAPATDKGSENRMVSGCSKLPKSKASTT